MDSLAVALYKQRREERLAARGIRIKKKQYRKTKDLKRLNKPDVVKAFRKDADGDADDQQNDNETTGGHGNTRLPFGLCKKYGIEVEDGWSPRDAWDALAGKGITPGEIYKKLKAGEPLEPDMPEPPKKDPVKTIDSGDGKYYLTGLYASKGWSSRGPAPYVLRGKAEWYDSVPEEDRHGYRSEWVGRFYTTTDLYLYLKKKGVEEFSDPETGELVNPVEMELPHVAYTDGERGYSAITLGVKGERYVLTGTDFDGKKRTIDDFATMEGAKHWIDMRGVSPDDVKLSPALKKREAERTEWLTSDKKKYFEANGTKYGDLHVTRDRYGDDYILHGASEDGEATERRFKSETDLMRFLKDAGVEDVRRPDRKHKNPMEEDVPEAIASIEGRYYKGFRFGLSPAGRLMFYGTGIDEVEYTLDSLPPYLISETTTSFMDKAYKSAGIDESQVSIDEETKKYIEEKKKDEEEVDRRRKEFPDKAIPVCSGMYMDVHVIKDGDIYRLQGYDQYGRARRIAGFRDMASLVSMGMEPFGLKPEDVFTQKELMDEYTKLKERIADFDARAITLGSYKYIDVGVEKEGDEYRLFGYDSSGRRRKLSSSGDFEEVKADVESRYGMGDSFDQFMLDPDVKSEYEAHRKRMVDFEARAVEIGGYECLDPHLEKSSYSDSEYIIVGYDRRGRKFTPIYGSFDIYDAVERIEKTGMRPDDMMQDPETKKAFEDYKKAKEKFDTESTLFDGTRYTDMTLGYDDVDYYILGKDIKGKRRRIKECRTASEIEKFVSEDPDHAFTFESIPKTDEMKERLKAIEKARSAIASGEYKDMGVDGSAFKNIHADKIGDKWSIKGVDIDGQEKQIVETKDWDDTVDTLERFGVTDYKLLTAEKTYSRPTDGMRHVVLMRGTDGSFRVYADSASKGTHAEVYATSSEDDAKKWLEDNNVSTSSIRTRGMNPNDDVPRSHTQSSLANFDTYRMDRLENSFIERLTDSEKKETADMLTEIFSQGSYRVARSTHSFGGIIEKGYKSQIETGTGGAGAYKGKDGRKRASEIFYGHGDLPDNEYEKCGYIGLSDEAEDWDDPGHPFYGGSSPMTYTLKKDTLKDRTTYTYGDSLNTRWSISSAGYAGDKPTIEGVTSLDRAEDLRSALKYWRKYKAGEIDYKEMFRRIRADADNRYIELQFHGPVTVQDIEKVSFNAEADIKEAFDHMKPERRKRVVKLLQENNVGILYRVDDQSEFMDGWDYVRQHYPDAFVYDA